MFKIFRRNISGTCIKFAAKKTTKEKVSSSILQELQAKFDEPEPSFADLLAKHVTSSTSDNLEPTQSTFNTKSKTVLEHYQEIKSRFPNYFVLYQVGEFYEIYGDDVEEASSIMDIATCKATKRRPTAMTGIPLKSSDNYIEKIIKAGKSVVVCDQIVERQMNGVDKFSRRISRIITPGTLTEDSLLDRGQYNFLLSISLSSQEAIGLAWIDISTGFFSTKCTDLENFETDLVKIDPKEILLSTSAMNIKEIKRPIEASFIPTTEVSPSEFCQENGKKKLLELYEKSLNKDQIGGLNISEFSLLEMKAVSALLNYLSRTETESNAIIDFPIRNNPSLSMSIDANTFRSLEIAKNIRTNSVKNSLLGVIDRTITAVGARLLARKLQAPSLDIKFLERQYDMIDLFRRNVSSMHRIREILKECHDLDRSMQRLSLNRQVGGPKDMQLIGKTLKQLPNIISLLQELKQREDGYEINLIIDNFIEKFDGFLKLQEEINSALLDELPSRPTEGSLIKVGYSSELDTIRNALNKSRNEFPNLLPKYKEITKKNSLKIVEKKLLGWFVEINASEKPIEASGFEFMSQIEGKIRYRTKELMGLRETHNEHEDELSSKEFEIYERLRKELIDNAERIKECSNALSELDVYTSFAHLSIKENLVRPILSTELEFDIKQGRHPVVEFVHLENDRQFIRNDCNLGPEQKFWLLTGPNMGGKSTFLRQNALIAIMAQAGCFVPANYAKIGIVDSVFSRVGATDDISRDRSTFMMEMIETSVILNNATKRSLVIMDEVGRGTSTEEGLSLASAICEHLVNVNECRTLFATHYHQLAKFVEKLPHTATYTTSAIENNDGSLTFLHQLKKGVANRSFGIQIAQLAGAPKSVIERALELHKMFTQN